MSKTMLLNVVNEEESRIAIVSNGLLDELSVETSQHEQIEGNIYCSKIVKIIPSLDAVFVDYGRERNGFLSLSDIHPSYYGEGDRKADRLRKGQRLMVQVRKGEVGQKGAALTTFVSIPGRYFVLMPFTSKRGVSRKIDDEATRKQLRQILDDSGIPDEMGYIARTAAEGRTKQELTRDASYLLRLWKRIRADYDAAANPGLLYQDSHIAIRTIRDYFNPAIREVWVDDREIYEQVCSFFQAVMPWHRKRVKLYQQKAPLFNKYNLEDQIASIYEKKIALPSGGSIVIEQTEALVSVDVNSGKTTKGKDIEETALIANLEAAEEAARQLRLRDLGGLVVIDFIDMRSAKNRNEVRKSLQKVLKEDKARTEIGTISRFGLLELSRQRIKPAATKGISLPCPLCHGSGQVRSTESFALTVLRLIRTDLARNKSVKQVQVGVPTDVATLLLNRKRAQIAEMEADFESAVAIFAEVALQPGQYFIEYHEKDNLRVVTNLPEDFPRSVLKATKGLPAVTTRAARPESYALFEDQEGEAPEVPDEPPEESAPEVGEVQEEKPAKKRRRRRRKKKSPGEGEKVDSEPSGGQTPDSQQADKQGATEVLSREGPKDDSEGNDQAAPKKLSASAKRRLRRKRKKALEAGQSSEGNGPGPEEAAAEESVQSSGASDEPSEAAEVDTSRSEKSDPGKRTPRRRRKRPTPKDQAGATEDRPEEEPHENQDSKDGKAGAPAEDESSSPKTQPRPRRKKRPSASSAQDKQGDPESDAAGKTPPPESSSSRSPRRRRSSRKTASPGGAEDTAPAAATPRESSGEASQAPEEAPKTRKTGTRKRRAPKKSAPKTGNGEETGSS